MCKNIGQEQYLYKFLIQQFVKRFFNKSQISKLRHHNNIFKHIKTDTSQKNIKFQN